MPDSSPFSREAILERTGGAPVCTECLPAADKPFLLRGGFWSENCPACKKVTRHEAMMPGSGSWDFKGKYEKPPG